MVNLSKVKLGAITYLEVSWTPGGDVAIIWEKKHYNFLVLVGAFHAYIDLQDPPPSYTIAISIYKRESSSMYALLS